MNASTVVQPGGVTEDVRRAVAETLARAAEERRPAFSYRRIVRIPVPDAETCVLVEVGRLASLLGRVLPCASLDATRPHLNGVLVQFSPPHVRVVATDGHRLALADGLADAGSMTAFEAMLPLSQVKRLLAFGAGLPRLSSDRTTVKLVPVVDGSYVVGVRASSADGSVVSLVTAQAAFPPYWEILDKLRCHEVTRLHAKYVVDALAATAKEKSVDDRYVDVWLPDSGRWFDPVVFAREDFACVVMPARKDSKEVRRT